MGVINIAADHQMFIALTGELKLTAPETISRWLILKKRKNRSFESPFRALRGNIRTPSMARWKARGRLYIRRN